MRLIPPTITRIFLVMMLALHLITRPQGYMLAPYNHLGWIIAIIGFMLTKASAKIFIRNNLMFNPQAKPTNLQTTRTYRISRNPMYLGLVLFLLGIAIGLNSLVSLLFPITLFFILDNKFIPREERNLKKAFKKDYSEYQKKVRRWL